MQNIAKKIFLFFLTTSLSMLYGLAQSSHLGKANVAFDLKEYENALRYYEAFARNETKTSSTNLPIYFRIAYCANKTKDIPKELFFLSKAYYIKPDRQILQKLTELAAQNGKNGYESDNVGFWILFFRNYTPFFVLFLVLVGIYVFSIFYLKKNRKQFVQNNHKLVLVLYIIGVFLLLNLPSVYKIAIVNKKHVNLRAEASGAAVVEDYLNEGDKVDVLNAQGQWYRIWWNNKSLYIRQNDVWIVK